MKHPSEDIMNYMKAGDPFTLALVSVPIYLLYELSIQIVKRTS